MIADDINKELYSYINLPSHLQGYTANYRLNRGYDTRDYSKRSRTCILFIYKLLWCTRIIKT